jgi:hypothetical protein
MEDDDELVESSVLVAALLSAVASTSNLRRLRNTCGGGFGKGGDGGLLDPSSWGSEMWSDAALSLDVGDIVEESDSDISSYNGTIPIFSSMVHICGSMFTNFQFLLPP